MKPRSVTSDVRPGDPGALIFAWERPRRRILRLTALLAVSFLGHAIIFYVLQVAYTPTAYLSPPPAEVVMLPPNSEENKALDRWLTFADPALMAQTSGPTTQQILAGLPFRYVPSYVAKPPAFKPLGLSASKNVPPRVSIFDAGPMPPLPESVMREARRTPVNAPNLLKFTGSIVDLIPRPLPAIGFNLKKMVGQKMPGQGTLHPLEPTVYLVGVPTAGGSPFLFLESSSSGTAAAADDSTRGADEYARDYLERLDFLPPPNAGSSPWGRATFYWGAEAYR